MKQTVCKVLNIFQHGKYLVAYVVNMLSVKYYYIFTCSYGRRKYCGIFHPKPKLILWFLLEMNCKIVRLRGA